MSAGAALPPGGAAAAARALCALCAARLHAQRALAAAGLLFGAVGWLGLPAAARLALPAAATALAAAALLAGLERYLAVRIALDARLFDELARSGAAEPDLAALDAGLAQLALAPAHKLGRPLAPRAAGALRLLRWHGATVAAQALLVLAAGSLA